MKTRRRPVLERQNVKSRENQSLEECLADLPTCRLADLRAIFCRHLQNEDIASFQRRSRLNPLWSEKKSTK